MLARWIAWIVLLNIGVGFCDCLRDPVSLPIHSTSSASLTTNTDRQGRPSAVTIANPAFVMRPSSPLNPLASLSTLQLPALRPFLFSPRQTPTRSA